MKVEPFRREDVEQFLELAAGEGWVAEAWEFEFLLRVFPQGCYCLRDASGKGLAFVTSIRHERSGWIGNLIVAEQHRGRGLGERLFRAALGALKDAGAATCWLTASESGRMLYEKHGFRAVDTIVRWSGSGRQRHAAHAGVAEAVYAGEAAGSIDRMAWGDCRNKLLAAIAGRGKVLQDAAGLAVLQPCGSAVQLGPFSALDSSSAEHLCHAALSSVPRGTRMYIDAPQSNRAAVRLFRRRGMQATGSTVLMYAGAKPAYRPELLYGLATMGSCG